MRYSTCKASRLVAKLQEAISSTERCALVYRLPFLCYGQQFALQCLLYAVYTGNRWHTEPHTHNGGLVGEDRPSAAFETYLMQN